MQRQVMWLSLMVTVLMPALVGAVTEADFEAKTTQNLLNLCSAPPNDPYYREAINFCEGYLVGAYQYYLSEIASDTSEAFVCLPTPPPSRNEAMRMLEQSLHHMPPERKQRIAMLLDQIREASRQLVKELTDGNEPPTRH